MTNRPSSADVTQTLRCSPSLGLSRRWQPLAKNPAAFMGTADKVWERFAKDLIPGSHTPRVYKASAAITFSATIAKWMANAPPREQAGTKEAFRGWPDQQWGRESVDADLTDFDAHAVFEPTCDMTEGVPTPVKCVNGSLHFVCPDLGDGCLAEGCWQHLHETCRSLQQLIEDAYVANQLNAQLPYAASPQIMEDCQSTCVSRIGACMHQLEKNCGLLRAELASLRNDVAELPESVDLKEDTGSFHGDLELSPKFTKAPTQPGQSSGLPDEMLD